jgi:selenocysteine-specific elongation factor
MTIDLGFAWLTLPGGESVGVIDVPGHIDFIKNMLAGVGGIDAALFIVAADEGVMPQTREHLAILDLLQVPAGVVALTKVDTITEEGWLELIEADLRDTLDGTRLADAPIIPVSARAGIGLDRLKQALADALASVPPRRDKGQPRLPVDRAFSVAGFGTVVTGTVSDGAFRVGDEVEIVPGGLKARIRSLQSHKRSVELGLPGSRLAINLTGIHPDQLRRGMVVTRPGNLHATPLIDVRLRLIAANSPLTGEAVAPLRHNQAVDFFSGAAETPARVRLLDAEQIVPGGEGWAQLRLEEPVAVGPGDRFIIRQASPSITIGGGVIVNPHPRRRWRRFQPEVLAQLDTLARGTPEDLLLHALATTELSPLRGAVERSGLDAATAEATLAHLIAEGQIIPLGVVQSPLVNSTAPALSLGGWHALVGRMTDALAEYHAQYPLRPGLGREELKSRMQGREKWPAKLFNELMVRAVAEGLVEEAGEYLRRPGFEISFAPEQQAKVDALLAAFRRQPYTPPSMAEAIAQTDADIISALVYRGTLARLSEDVLFEAKVYDEMVARIMAHIKAHGSMTVAQVRDAFNTSRKYALAIMEYLDEKKITRRVGDERVLR